MLIKRLFKQRYNKMLSFHMIKYFSGGMLKLSNNATISSFMGGGPHTHTLSYTSVGNVLLNNELNRYEVKSTF